MKNKIFRFLKPNFKKILVLLILISPVFGSYLLGSLPAQFSRSPLATYLKFNMIPLFLLMLISIFIFRIGPGIGSGAPDWQFLLALVGSYLISTFFWYSVSCLIVSIWNRIFRFFGERAKLYEKIVGIFLLILFIFSVIVLPTISTYLVTIEKITRPTISFDEAYRDDSIIIPSPGIGPTISFDEAYQDDIKFQEIKIRNDSILLVAYKLPDVTVCLHDIEGNLTLGYAMAYRTEDGEYVEDKDEFHRNVILLQAKSETKIYLQEYIDIIGKGSEEFVYEERDRFDQFLLLTNVGFNNYNYCYDAKEEDILNSEKIEILK